MDQRAAKESGLSETGERIEAVRRQWGRQLLILGHHYQVPEVLRHADAIGDSLELSRRAAAEEEAERIVFCGVHFMAESAAIMSRRRQTVYMPDVEAGCPMAEMAPLPDVLAAWQTLARAGGPDWLPVAYVNSTAAIKAFCGREGGSTCTSSNAAKVIRWAREQGARVFFLPDEHLGANTARDLGIPDAQVAVYDPARPQGGLDTVALQAAAIVVWKGYCHVHTVFNLAQVAQVRRRWPQARIIVHPETPKEVVRQCDAHGSTSQIIDYVRRAPDGALIVVGTETHLVERLAAEQKGRVEVRPLTHSVCPNMARTTPAKLAALLTSWPQGNLIRVAPDTAAEARLALDRMLRL
jgi:quinolinate synthase